MDPLIAGTGGSQVGVPAGWVVVLSGVPIALFVLPTICCVLLDQYLARRSRRGPE